MLSETYHQEEDVDLHLQSIKVATKNLSSTALIEQKAAITTIRHRIESNPRHEVVLAGVNALGDYANSFTPLLNFEHYPRTEDTVHELLITTGKEHPHVSIKKAVVFQLMRGLFERNDPSGKKHKKLVEGITTVASTIFEEKNDSTERVFVHTLAEKFDTYTSNGAHPDAKKHALMAKEFVLASAGVKNNS